MRVSVVTRRSVAASVLGLGLVLGGAAQAQYATVELAVKDRKFEPAEIKAPANARIVIRITNRSQVPYHPEYLRLFTQDRNKAKRTAMQQAAIEPVYAGLPAKITGRSRETFALSYPLFTPLPGTRNCC